jgi:hypothetical protein
MGMKTTPPASTFPTAGFMGKLQHLEQQDPTLYTQVASRIATELEADAKTAQTGGETNTLNQLATAFQNSAQTGHLPSAQELQQAVLFSERIAGNTIEMHLANAFSKAMNSTSAPASPTS